MLVGEVETDDDGEVELEVGGKFSSRDGRSSVKDVKCRFNVRIYDSVNSGVDRIFGDEFLEVLMVK